MSRKVVDVSTQQLLGEKAKEYKNIYQRIEALAAAGALTPDLKDWAHEGKYNELDTSTPNRRRISTCRGLEGLATTIRADYTLKTTKPSIGSRVRLTRACRLQVRRVVNLYCHCIDFTTYRQAP